MQGRLRTRRHDASDASPKVLASGSGKIRADGLGSHRCRHRAGGLSARRAAALSRWADRQRPVKSKAAFRGPALPRSAALAAGDARDRDPPACSWPSSWPGCASLPPSGPFLYPVSIHDPRTSASPIEHTILTGRMPNRVDPSQPRARGYEIPRCGWNANAALFASGGCASPSRVFVQQPSKPLYCLVRLADLTKCLLQDSGVAERNARGCRVGSQ